MPLRRRLFASMLVAPPVAVAATSRADAAPGRPDHGPRPGPRQVVAKPFAQLQRPPRGSEPLPNPESPAFSRAGELFWVTVWGYRGHSLFKTDLRSRRSTGIAVTDPSDPDWSPTFVAIAFHKDGSLWAADFAGQKIVRIDTTTWTSKDVITQPMTGAPTFYPDDLVFDRAGNLYITDLQGDVTDPRGRVYRYGVDGELSVVAEHLASPNGIALSPDEGELWFSEYHANRLLRAGLQPDGTVTHFPYFDLIEVIANFSGPGLPDSLKVDRRNNVYLAFYKGGRLLVLSEYGDTLAEVSLQGGAEEFRQTTNLVIRPGTRDAYLIAGGTGGARFYTFTALAAGPEPFSHQ
jgi:lactonase